MDGSSIVSLVMIVVAMAAGLVTFGLLRERGRACAYSRVCIRRRRGRRSRLFRFVLGSKSDNRIIS